MDRCTKSALPIAALFFLLTSSGFAASVSSRYTCLMGHEKEAIDKLQTFGNQAILNFFKKKNIGVDSSTLQFMVNLTSETNYGGAPYVSFSGNVGGASSGAYTSSTSVGTIASKDGTKFNILFSSGSDSQDKGDYRVEASQTGFDREGNPINGHCRLKLFNSGDSDATKTLLVLNARSGHILGLIPLPAEIFLY
jgi:hypothetical protein